MASVTSAAVQNENLHIHRGKGVDGAKAGVVQNENLHIHRGKGQEGFNAELRKPAKTGRQERKALRDLSRAEKPVLSTATKGKPAAATLKDKSAAAALKDKSAAPTRLTAKKPSKSNILSDEEIAKCQEWAKEGIEHMPFSGNDMQRFEAHQQEERVKKKVDKVMSALRAWTDMTFGLEVPVKEVPSDTEDVLQLEFEPEVLPPSPKTNLTPKSGYEEVEEIFELNYDSLYLDRQWDIKLKEEYESDTTCF